MKYIFKYIFYSFTFLGFYAVQAQEFSFFQPQEKRDSILPIFNVGKTESYQIEFQREIIENDEKIKATKIQSALGMEVQRIDNQGVTLNFIIAKNQLLQRTFNSIFTFDDANTQPIEINILIDEKTKFLKINNYPTLAQMLLSELEILRKSDAKYEEKNYYNAIEKLKFDLKNGSEQLLKSTFLDLVYYFSAYNFPIDKKQLVPFYRSDYEYFAASRACVSEYKKFGEKDFYAVRYNPSQDNKAKSATDAAIEKFNLRYSVYFDKNNLPRSVGLFLMQQTGSQKVIETWTLLKVGE